MPVRFLDVHASLPNVCIGLPGVPGLPTFWNERVVNLVQPARWTPTIMTGFLVPLARLRDQRVTVPPTAIESGVILGAKHRRQPASTIVHAVAGQWRATLDIKKNGHVATQLILFRLRDRILGVGLTLLP